MYTFTLAPEASFLTGYELPELTFADDERLSPEIRTVWALLRKGNHRAALTQARTALQDLPHRAFEEQAALLAGMAAAEARLGNLHAAKRLAEQSLVGYGVQWIAHRVQLQLFLGQRAYETAYVYLATLELPACTALWDEPLTPRQHYLSTAACAWHIRDWEGVAERLALAYPEGLATMPENLLEDWFRLSLYRNQAYEAAAAAAILTPRRSVEAADAILQTLVQQGWTEHALPLYRAAFAEAPTSALLRRRLVALCIREGAIDEARHLARPGALDLAA